jgi:hypothetical protein
LVNGTSGFEQPARMKANAERAAKDLLIRDRNRFCISLVFGIGMVGYFQWMKFIPTYKMCGRLIYCIRNNAVNAFKDSLTG